MLDLVVDVIKDLSMLSGIIADSFKCRSVF